MDWADDVRRGPPVLVRGRGVGPRARRRALGRRHRRRASCPRRSRCASRTRPRSRAIPGERGRGALRRGRVRRLPLVRRAAHRAAVLLRPRPLVHDVRARRAARLGRASCRRPSCSTATTRPRRRAGPQHGHAARRRGRAVLRARRGGVGRAAAARAEGVRQGLARCRARPARSTLELDRRAFAFWDVDADDWTVEPGEFELRIGTSSRDIAHRVVAHRHRVSAVTGRTARRRS